MCLRARTRVRIGTIEQRSSRVLPMHARVSAPAALRSYVCLSLICATYTDLRWCAGRWCRAAGAITFCFMSCRRRVMSPAAATIRPRRRRRRLSDLSPAARRDGAARRCGATVRRDGAARRCRAGVLRASTIPPGSCLGLGRDALRGCNLPHFEGRHSVEGGVGGCGDACRR